MRPNCALFFTDIGGCELAVTLIKNGLTRSWTCHGRS